MAITKQSHSSFLDLGALAMLSVISSIIYRLSLVYNDPISGDFPVYIEIAQGLSLDPATFDPSGFWPLGYPLTLRTLSFLANWHYAGAVISFISLLAVSISSFYILRSGFGFLSSFIGSLSVLMNPSIITWSVGHSSDMPCLAMAFLSIAFFMAWRHTANAKTLIASGGLAGFSYLFRYSSLSLLISLSLLVILSTLSLFRSNRLEHIGSPAILCKCLLIFIGGWTMGASPQLVGSWLVHGNPLYNENGCNVALSIGWRQSIPGLTWFNVKNVFPECKSLLNVIHTHPYMFFKNFLLNFWGSLFIMRYSLIVYLSSLAILLAASRKNALLSSAAFSIVIGAFVIGAINVLLISLAFVSDRHLIMSISLLSCTGYAAIAECVFNSRLRRSVLDQYHLLFIFAAILIIGVLGFHRGLKSLLLYSNISARTAKTINVIRALSTYKCRAEQDELHGKTDTLLIGDDFIDPSSYTKIGHQEWRKNYRSFTNPKDVSNWMRANSFNCVIVDNDSLGSRLPGFDLVSWKKEYIQQKFFGEAWKLADSETYIFRVN